MEDEGSTALEAVTRQMVKTQQTENTYCVAVNFRVCELVTVLQLPVVTFCKSSINPIPNSNPVYSHSYT
jgi:hypothetical protein